MLFVFYHVSPISRNACLFWPRNVNILCGGWGRGVGVCRLEFFSKVKMRHFTSFSTVEIMLRHTPSVDHPTCWAELPQVTQCTIPHVDLSFHRSLSAPSHMFTWAPTGHSVHHPTCWLELPQMTQCTIPHVDLSSHRSPSAPSHMLTWAPTHSVHPLYIYSQGPRWRSGNTLASHLWGRWLKPRTLCGKAGSCLPMVSSLQYRTLTNCMHWFLLPTKLPVVIWAVQCWKQR